MILTFNQISLRKTLMVHNENILFILFFDIDRKLLEYSRLFIYDENAPATYLIDCIFIVRIIKF